jgi:mannose-1-phosphate guanylyltransferase
MIAVIIAGGSGTRLWPLSTPYYPKHLLTVGLQNRSLLQQTYDRIAGVADSVYVVSEKSHDSCVRDQLPELPDDHCIVEPTRKGTANCTLLALDVIGRTVDPEETIVILWADHFIRDTDGFAHTIRVASRVAQEQKKLVLVGVKPNYPATGFGYIKKKALLPGKDYVYLVDSFKEKPSADVAERYFQSGNYLWNSGYFIATIKELRRLIKQYSPELQNFDASNYEQLKSLNIDNALIERIPDLLVVPASFDWMDLGSYQDLHNAQPSDANGNVVRGNIELLRTENSYIENQEDKPLAVIGLDNVAVVNTKVGILVTRKDLSQSVGEVSKRLNQ